MKSAGTRPTRRSARLAVIAVATVVAVLGAAPVAMAGPPGEHEVGIRETGLTVPTTDGLALPATLRTPVDAPAGGPAMVLVHGAGDGPRDKYRTEAEAFTRAGITTLVYDKRSVGYSQTERSYSQLADDAVAAAEVLRAQPGVDPAKVGIWGISEGGWVAPLAASRAPETAFLVVVGANGVEPLRQQTWAEALKVQAAGVQGSLVEAASSGVYRLINSMGLFPEPYYDPGPALRDLTLPVLGIWGALDRSTPPVESVAAFRQELEQAGNTHYTLRTFDGAEHSLRTTVDGFTEGPDFAPGYVDLVGSWVHLAAAGQAPPTSVAGTGEQARPTADVPPSAWYESGPAHGVALGLMVAGFVGFGLVAAIRRLNRIVHPGAAPEAAPVAARVLAAAGLATVLGTLVYLGVLTVTRGGHAIDPGPLLAGRPLPWLAVQALAVTTVAAGIVLATGLVRERGGVRAGRAVALTGTSPGTARSGGERVRLTMLLVGAAAFVPWALYWDLLVP